MAEALTASITEEGLEALSAGQRGWFWLCTEALSPTPMLLLEPLLTDPEMTVLMARVATATTLDGARPVMGLASVGADGRLSLGAPGLAREHLVRLAQWAALRLPSHPRLARLSNVSLHSLDASGVVQSIWRDPLLWEDFPPLKVRGTIAHSAHRLRQLKPGQEAWLWMTASGPARRPFLALGSVARDPDGFEFATQIAETRRRSPDPGRQVGGTLQITDEGEVLISTTASLKNTRRIITALLSDNELLLERLAGARLVQLRDGIIVNARQIPEP